MAKIGGLVALAKLSIGERAVCICDDIGLVVFVSPDAHLVLGGLLNAKDIDVPAEKDGPTALVGLNVCDALTPEDGDEYLACLARRSCDALSSCLLRCVDGAFLWLDVSTVRVTRRLRAALTFSEGLRRDSAGVRPGVSPCAFTGPSSPVNCSSTPQLLPCHKVEDHVMTKHRPLSWWMMASEGVGVSSVEEGEASSLGGTGKGMSRVLSGAESSLFDESSPSCTDFGGGASSVFGSDDPGDDTDVITDDSDSLTGGREYSFTEVFNFISRQTQGQSNPRCPSVGSFMRPTLSISRLSLDASEGPDEPLADRLRSILPAPEEGEDEGWMGHAYSKGGLAPQVGAEARGESGNGWDWWIDISSDDEGDEGYHADVRQWYSNRA